MAPLAPQIPPLTHQKPSDLELDDVSSSSSSSSSSSFVPSPPKQRPNHSTSTVLARPTSAVSTAESVLLEVAKYWGLRLYKHILYPHDPQAYFVHLLQVASNYEQWSEAATILDELQGKDKWKNDPRSPDYDYELIKTRLDQLRIERKKHDMSSMIFLLRTSLSRNLGDMGKPKLYAHTHIGTKKLISDYIDEVVTQLNIICDTESDDFDLKSKYEFFLNVRQSFGRTALLLSGGATLGLNHIGVIKCLHEVGLLPRIISGASSGSIIAALLCTRTDDKICDMYDPNGVSLDFFERSHDPDTVGAKLERLWKQGVLFDVEVLTEAMQKNIGDVTFQEAYNRTRRILNITVSSSMQYEMPRLLNYLTAPNVLIRSAVAASCAVPGIFPSSSLYAKDKNGKIDEWNPSGNRWIDGSVENDLPMNKLSELFNVNHFIVCQVNPHVIPFLQKSLNPSKLHEFAAFAMFLARSEIQHRCHQVTELGIFPSFFYKVQAIMSQRYYGDITIVPDIGYADFVNILSNPTPKMVIEATIRGEQATWPKVSIMKNHLQIELTIDAIIYRLRLRRLAETIQQAEQDKQAQSPEQANADPLMPLHSRHHRSSVGEHDLVTGPGLAWRKGLVFTSAHDLADARPPPPGPGPLSIPAPVRSRSTPSVPGLEEEGVREKRRSRMEKERKEEKKEKERGRGRDRETGRSPKRMGLSMTNIPPEEMEAETKAQSNRIEKEEVEWDEVVMGFGGGGKPSEVETVVVEEEEEVESGNGEEVEVSANGGSERGLSDFEVEAVDLEAEDGDLV